MIVANFLLYLLKRKGLRGLEEEGKEGKVFIVVEGRKLPPT